MPERKETEAIARRERRPSRRCEYCAGEKPLHVKPDTDYAYHLKLWIDNDMLFVDAALGYKIRKDDCRFFGYGQGENIPVRVGIRIYCCPVCGKLLGNRARWAAYDTVCTWCGVNGDYKNKNILRIDSPGTLYLAIRKRNIQVSGNLGFEWKGRNEYISNLDQIPISYCFICGDKLPEEKDDDEEAC